MNKRQRHVFSNREIPRLWTHQTQDEARNGTGSFCFRGATIYSYGSHFPIATHVTEAQGQAGILFTSKKNSVTTSQHMCDKSRRISDFPQPDSLAGQPVECFERGTQPLQPPAHRLCSSAEPNSEMLRFLEEFSWHYAGLEVSRRMPTNSEVRPRPEPRKYGSAEAAWSRFPGQSAGKIAHSVSLFSLGEDRACGISGLSESERIRDSARPTHRSGSTAWHVGKQAFLWSRSCGIGRENATREASHAGRMDCYAWRFFESGRASGLS
jgi:hypothetical protein